MSKDKLEHIELKGELFFKIKNSDDLRPFLMTLVSEGNHWMFLSSNGGLSAGRKNAENALFPYYTDDKITDLAEVTGSKTILKVYKQGKIYIWEPFSLLSKGRYKTTQNLYKNQFGNKVIFEEINHDLELRFSYQWSTSNSLGFIRDAKIENISKVAIEIETLDGLQNLLPAGVGSDLQLRFSNLANAYKRSELVPESGLGIYAMTSKIVDKAEPAESLKANIVWSMGLNKPIYLLSSLQLENFRSGQNIKQETDVKAEKGAYFIYEKSNLSPYSSKNWYIVADVNKSHAEVIELVENLKNNKLTASLIEQKIDESTERLLKLSASADALQKTADQFKDARHFSNTLFNIMRGGVFDFNYQIEKDDLLNYLKNENNTVFTKFYESLLALPESFSLTTLQDFISESKNQDITRLCTQYLPLKFSRRHGDPSRPWNKFSINTRSEVDGSKILDYEGNWRDIFQNWEALAQSFPEFIVGMIFKFLNASTFDGYNPYRITKNGFDWETIEPDDPWSFIGYWGDHQIIYLLKLLELAESHKPGILAEYFKREEFVYANVPYKIKSYQEILNNPKDTIDFDFEADKKIRNRRLEIGADAALLVDKKGDIVRANFLEKILASVLAKLSNFIPEAGIWMNTQRPEWNDANNALVGNGVSMVTLYYLRRFMNFFQKIVTAEMRQEVFINAQLKVFFDAVNQVLKDNKKLLQHKLTDEDRKAFVEAVGRAGSHYRNDIYQNSFSQEKHSLSFLDLERFIETALTYIDHSIQQNKRGDHLYHSYNLIQIDDKQAKITYLDEMLEGQVAILSSGYLRADKALTLLDSLKQSKLYRKDQNSYILYPNKELPGFLNKNTIPKTLVNQSKLLVQFINDGNKQLVQKDLKDAYHFNGNFTNINDVKNTLDSMSQTKYARLVSDERALILDIFEVVFKHKSYTGRSGTMYGYEGLGSIYWHMVSKLLLAVQENVFWAINQKAEKDVINRLKQHYHEINEGIGVHKSPEKYGAFPTDAYSHTPEGKGAQQPGMTGQVKEDIICRFGELGVSVKSGQISFNTHLLHKESYRKQVGVYKYYDVNGVAQHIELPINSLAFTYCQVPIVYHLDIKQQVEVIYNNDNRKTFVELELNKEISQQIFQRIGQVKVLHVYFLNKNL